MPSYKSSQPNNERAIALTRAAKQAGVGYRVLRRAAGNELPAYRISERTIRVFMSDVAKWLRSHQLPASDHPQRRVGEILADDDTVKETAARG